MRRSSNKVARPPYYHEGCGLSESEFECGVLVRTSIEVSVGGSVDVTVELLGSSTILSDECRR